MFASTKKLKAIREKPIAVSVKESTSSTRSTRTFCSSSLLGLLDNLSDATIGVVMMELQEALLRMAFVHDGGAT
jgi:hypothetical protein